MKRRVRKRLIDNIEHFCWGLAKYLILRTISPIILTYDMRDLYKVRQAVPQHPSINHDYIIEPHDAVTIIVTTKRSTYLQILLAFPFRSKCVKSRHWIESDEADAAVDIMKESRVKE